MSVFVPCVMMTLNEEFTFSALSRKYLFYFVYIREQTNHLLQFEVLFIRDRVEGKHLFTIRPNIQWDYRIFGFIYVYIKRVL